MPISSKTNVPSTDRPWVVLVDASIDTTGALVAASREALALRDEARFLLVLPKASRVLDSAFSAFDRVERLPIVSLRKSVPALLLYLPALLVSGWKLRGLLRSTSCERLQINDFYLMQGGVVRLLGYRGLIVTWVRIDPRLFGAMGRIWLTIARQTSNRLVAVSRFIQALLPEGAATIAYDPAPVAPPMAPDGNVSRQLVFVGNYIEGKGQHVAIAAFHQIAACHPDAELIFHGSDMGLIKNQVYRAALEQQAAAGPGAGRIKFRGPSNDLATVYRTAFAALNLSHSESFSLTVQEAGAYGLPVVATRSGGPEEIVQDGETGYLIDVGDADAAADRLSRLLADPDRATRMGRAAARSIATRFSAAAFRDQAKRLLNL